MNTALAVLITLLIISSAAAYKLPENKVLKESLCPSHIAGAERLVFNSLMHGVGSEEEFKKTIINKLINDSKSINYDFPDGVLDILKDVWDQRNIFPVNAAINIVVLLVLMILFMLYICLLNPFCWCCCSCCCMKNYENEVDDEYIEEMEKLPKGVDPPPFKTLPSRDSSRDDCCSCCCCCCGRKCGYCCLTFAFLCCLVAIFFGFYAYANHPLGGFPARLTGKIDTNEDMGVLRIMDVADNTVQGIMNLVQDTIMNVVVGDFVVDKVCSVVVDTVTRYISLTDVATNLTTIIDIVDKLVTPDEISKMINDITGAINSFITEDEVNDKISNFTISVDKISESINNTIESVENCTKNVKESEKINFKNSCESTTNDCFDLDDAGEFDNLVNVTNRLGKNGFEELLLTNWSTWNAVNTCLSSNNNCEKELDSIKDSIELTHNLNQNKIDEDITKFGEILGDIDKYITNYNKYLNSEGSVFGILQNSIKEDDFKKLADDLLSINTSLYDMNVDSLKSIIGSINDTLNAIPSFSGIAETLENVLSITEIVPYFKNITNQLSNMVDNLIDNEDLSNTIKDISNMTDSITEMTGDTDTIINTIKNFDQNITGAFNTSQFIEIIDNIKDTAIKSAESANIGSFSSNITDIANMIFKIYDVSKSIYDSLELIQKVYNESISATDTKLTKLANIVNNLDKEVYDSYNNCKTSSSCDKLKSYFTNSITIPTNSTFYNGLSDNFDKLYTAINPKSVSESSRMLEINNEMPISYLTYIAIAQTLPDTMKSMNDSMSALDSVNKEISSGKSEMDGIIKPLSAVNSTMHSVTGNIDTFSDINENTYRKYHNYLDNTTAMFDELNIPIPKNDSGDKNTFAGKLQNLFVNPLNAHIDTMSHIGGLIENVAHLVDNFTNELHVFSEIDFTEWNKAISKTEDWVLSIINYVFPNDPSFSKFFKEDDNEYKDYKDVVVKIADRNQFKDSTDYLTYILTLGGKATIAEMFENATNRTEGFIFAENTTNIECLTSQCIKETVNEVWNTAKLSLFTGKPEDDKSDNAKYLKYAGIGIGVVQTIVIVFPLFLFLIQLMYVGFRLKGHNCCCECQFSLVACCCSCVLLLFAFFGIFGIIPMVLCNMVPDIADIAVEIDTVTKQLNKKDVMGMDMAYNESSKTLKLNGTMSGYELDANIYLEDIIKGYLGGNCDDIPAPLNRTAEGIYSLAKSIYDDEVVTMINDTLKDTGMLKSEIIDPIMDVVQNGVTDMLHDFIFSILGKKGIASCDTITSIGRPIVDLVCCDLMNDAIALSAASVLIGIFMFVSTCSIPCANVCLGEGDLTEFKTPSKEFEKKQKEEKKKGKEDEKERKKREREDKKSKKLEKKESNTAPEDNGAFQMRKKKK